VPNDYKEALEYLYGLTNYEIKSRFNYAPQFFDLQRVERLLNDLGNPHRQFRSVHVAGTKGKGSTCAMLASVLKAAGFRTGLYTSPHLHSFRERIQVNDELVSAQQFAALTHQLRPLAQRDPELTTFEVATALAFAHFAQAGVDIAVVEVGLGGRLDATNVVLPSVSVITKIGHDHMHILGNTLSEIAAEKAGIIKPAVPVVAAPQPSAALAVLQETCREKNAPLHEVGREWQWRATENGLNGQRFTVSRRNAGRFALPPRSYKDLRIPLLGKHQLRNAAVALATIDALRNVGTEITEANVRAGLAEVVWPARFEVLGSAPYFVVDGAHNVDSARALAATLQQYFPGAKPWLVLAILTDKDIRAILQQLMPLARGAIFARSTHPRAADPQHLQIASDQYGIPTSVIDDVSSATRRALAQAGPDGLVVAAGSFSTAGQAREAWLRLHHRPLPPLDPL
jgi:dihydrofolate synthase/folylpolyglutamate synthase